MHGKHTFRLPTELTRRLDDYATAKRVPRVKVVEIALESFLSPDSADRLEATLARRLDRMSRAIERLERHSTITNEALALFIRFWLTHTPPLPDTAEPAAQSRGRERYAGFLEAVGRRLAHGETLVDDIAREIEAAPQAANKTK
jgi:predicted transcriptional regulator